MKGQNTGVANEVNIVAALNGKLFSSVNATHRHFLSQIYPGINGNDVIHAEKIGGLGLKPDVVITANESKCNVSVKKGGGNSVHQENIKYFIPFCKSVLGMTDVERDDFLKFLYGDGTLDGHGDLADRMSQEDVIRNYTEEIRSIQSFLDRNKRVLVERFLIYGRLGAEKDIKADYVYHGDEAEAVWCPLSTAVDYLIDQTAPSDGPSIGPLTLQTWGRNLSGVEAQEDRRNSIQVKWATCRDDIQEINEQYLASLEDEIQEVERVVGNNSHGFQNSRDIVNAINGARVMYLQPTLRNMVRSAFPDIALTDIVNAKLIGRSKADVQIIRNGVTRNIAVYMGGGNSVHQEDFNSFISWCRSELGLTSTEETAFRYVFYADGTTDNSGPVSRRLSSKTDIVSRYGDYVHIVQSFLSRHVTEFAKRFLITGKYDDAIEPDFLFYGTPDEGKTIPYRTILRYLNTCEPASRAILAVGPLSIQMWNRNLGGEADKEYKRNSLQVKWCNISGSIEAANAMHVRDVQIGMREGLSAEYDLVGLLNSSYDRTSAEWDLLRQGGIDIDDNTYAMKLSKQVYSPLLDRKVFPKSDVVLIKADISQELLDECNYLIDEDFLIENGVTYSLISHSGISCKHPESDRFTYAKMAPSSFEKIFGSRIEGACYSIFERSGDVHLNHKLITDGWGISEIEFLRYVTQIPGIGGLSSIGSMSPEQAHRVKEYTSTIITDKIKTNSLVRNMIFTGEGVYPDPYCARYLFSHNELENIKCPDVFHVTTGSGRHKGVYNLVIKP